MSNISCPVNGCGFESNSGRGVSIHASQKHPDKNVSFENKTEFTCAECGETFRDYKSRRSSKNEENNFCSRQCKDEFERNGKTFTCSWCGNSTYKPKSHFEKMGNYSIDNHFCDKECEQLWKQEHWTGKDHPSWAGGSPTHRGANWPEMRRQALNRDNYSCQVCSMTREEHYNRYGKDLDVHHKIPAKAFETIGDANYLVNLLTVCRSCHGTLDVISRRESQALPTVRV